MGRKPLSDRPMTALERQRRHRARMRIERETTHHHPEVHRLIVSLRRAMRLIERASDVVQWVVDNPAAKGANIDYSAVRKVAAAWSRLAYAMASISLLLDELESPTPTTK